MYKDRLEEMGVRGRPQVSWMKEQMNFGGKEMAREELNVLRGSAAIREVRDVKKMNKDDLMKSV